MNDFAPHSAPPYPTRYAFVDRPRHWPSIDGVTFPWAVARDPGPMVAPTGPDNTMHILWIPVLVRAPLPTPPVGTPDGTALLDTQYQDDDGRGESRE